MKSVMKIMMKVFNFPDCKEAARLLSQSRDTNLSMWERVGLRMHLKMCRFCDRYDRQIESLSKIFKAHDQYVDVSSIEKNVTLSKDATFRLKKSIEQSDGGVV